MKKAMLGVMAVILVALQQANAARDRYVVPVGTPGVVSLSPHTSWATAATNAGLIAAALTSGDRIIFSNGVHVLTNVMNMTANNIQYVGLTGNPDDVIISGGGTVRCCYISSGTNQLVVSLTVSNGVASDAGGAGFMIYGAPDLTISNCVITRNVSSGGPAGITVLNNSPRFRLIDCKVRENVSSITATIKGVGLAYGITNTGSGGMVVSNCVFSGNTNNSAGALGSGVYIGVSPTVYFYNCVFSNNYANGSTAGGGGGGYSESPVWLDNCTFVSNSTAKTGGGWVAIITNSVFTNKCVFRGNRASSYGGGLYLPAGGTVDGATFVENEGSYGGGVAIYGAANGRVQVLNSVFSNNVATAGGAVCVYPGAVGLVTLIRNCLIVSNNASGSGTTLGGAAFCLAIPA